MLWSPSVQIGKSVTFFKLEARMARGKAVAMLLDEAERSR